MHTKEKIKEKKKLNATNLSKYQGQLGVRLGFKWNKSSVLIPVHFYLLGPHFLPLLFHIFIKIYENVFHFFASLGTLSWDFLGTKAYLCLFPECQFWLYCQALTGGSWTPNNALYVLRRFLYIKLATNTLVA